MAFSLNNLTNRNRKKASRVGRGNGSGHGTFSGRGQKGQRSRSGGRGGLALKGFRRTMLRIPKMKGNKPVSPKSEIIKLSALEKHLTGGEVSKAILLAKGLIHKLSIPVKILADIAEIKGKYQVVDCLYSEKAKTLIEKAGGSVDKK